MEPNGYIDCFLKHMNRVKPIVLVQRPEVDAGNLTEPANERCNGWAATPGELDIDIAKGFRA
eukprot:1181541-Prymnesium_polylepis.2